MRIFVYPTFVCTAQLVLIFYSKPPWERETRTIGRICIRETETLSSLIEEEKDF